MEEILKCISIIKNSVYEADITKTSDYVILLKELCYGLPDLMLVTKSVFLDITRLRWDDFEAYHNLVEKEPEWVFYIERAVTGIMMEEAIRE